jgi:hypothetical protein
MKLDRVLSSLDADRGAWLVAAPFPEELMRRPAAEDAPPLQVGGIQPVLSFDNPPAFAAMPA